MTLFKCYSKPMKAKLANKMVKKNYQYLDLQNIELIFKIILLI